MKIQNATSGAGKSLLEMLWDELDTVMDRLMVEGAPTRSSSDSPGDIESAWQTYGEERGQAQGLAYAIAVITTPYEPDVPNIKKVSLQRWEARNAEA